MGFHLKKITPLQANCLLLFFLLAVNNAIAPKISFALFSTTQNSSLLSYVYGINAFVYFFTINLIIIGVTRYIIISLALLTYIIFVAIVFLNIILLLLPLNFVTTSILIISADNIKSVGEIMLWAMVCNLFSTQTAKRVFVYFGASYAFGFLVGSFLLSKFSKVILPIHYYVICLMLLMLSIACIYIIKTKSWYRISREEPSTLYEFFKFLSSSTHWMKILFIPFSVATLFYLSDYIFNSVAGHTFSSF